MSDALLKQVITLFPNEQHYQYGTWRDCITKLRSFVMSLSEMQQISLFEIASSQLTNDSVTNRKRLPLWFFSHPTYDVFRAFLFDEAVCRSFADYLAQRHFGRKALRKKKQRMSSVIDMLKFSLLSWKKTVLIVVYPGIKK